MPVTDTQLDSEAFGVMWTPDVAVAIAQLLEWWATGFGEGEEMDDSIIDDHALAIADAVLVSAPNFRASWWVNPAPRSTCDVEMEDGDPCLLPEDHEGAHS
ncbi:hypothetical protein [Aeromicrobium sp. Leaf291]|uniref:hypothetical protein n=1 Tax=Aeromicrobium sp. Leaf291 TaxID=1736325 RepID=UPI0012E1015C|nr:hypothetical protein [Aeromicrobium sp. Leaf291]